MFDHSTSDQTQATQATELGILLKIKSNCLSYVKNY